MMLPKVYVAALNWNNAADTCVCLESLLALDYPNVELVFCDNASRPESVEANRFRSNISSARSESCD